MKTAETPGLRNVQLTRLQLWAFQFVTLGQTGIQMTPGIVATAKNKAATCTRNVEQSQGVSYDCIFGWRFPGWIDRSPYTTAQVETLKAQSTLNDEGFTRFHQKACRWKSSITIKVMS